MLLKLKLQAVKYLSPIVKLSQLAGSCKGVGSVGLELTSSIDSRIRASVESVVNFHLIDSLRNVLADQDFRLLDIYGRHFSPKNQINQTTCFRCRNESSDLSSKHGRRRLRRPDCSSTRTDQSLETTANGSGKSGVFPSRQALFDDVFERRR